MQCIAGAMVAGTAATGSRWWIIARFRDALTPGRKKALSAVLITAGVLVGGMIGPTP
jgi:hypothetical protein